jgi:hypothetical protein
MATATSVLKTGSSLFITVNMANACLTAVTTSMQMKKAGVHPVKGVVRNAARVLCVMCARITLRVFLEGVCYVLSYVSTVRISSVKNAWKEFSEHRIKDARKTAVFCSLLMMKGSVRNFSLSV